LTAGLVPVEKILNTEEWWTSKLTDRNPSEWETAIVILCASVYVSYANISETKRDRSMVTVECNKEISLFHQIHYPEYSSVILGDSRGRPDMVPWHRG